MRFEALIGVHLLLLLHAGVHLLQLELMLGTLLIRTDMLVLRWVRRQSLAGCHSRHAEIVILNAISNSRQGQNLILDNVQGVEGFLKLMTRLAVANELILSLVWLHFIWHVVVVGSDLMVNKIECK
jgi:hypothetical protein